MIQDDQNIGIEEPAFSRIEKCDLCLKQWDPGPNNTRLVYCYICGGKFDLKCWQKHRDKEIRNGDYIPP
jgi:hypothetical protein